MSRRPWTKSEDTTLKGLVGHYGDKRGPQGKWEEISRSLPGRTKKDCRKRWFHSLDPSVKKGRWTAEEDRILLQQHSMLGPAWKDIALKIPGRKDDQCSKRYCEILDPLVKDRLRDWAAEEDAKLTELVGSLGTTWSAIAAKMEGRPALTCRNRWRRLNRKGHGTKSLKKSNATRYPFSSLHQMSAAAMNAEVDSLEATGASDSPSICPNFPNAIVPAPSPQLLCELPESMRTVETSPMSAALTPAVAAYASGLNQYASGFPEANCAHLEDRTESSISLASQFAQNSFAESDSNCILPFMEEGFQNSVIDGSLGESDENIDRNGNVASSQPLALWEPMPFQLIQDSAESLHQPSYLSMEQPSVLSDQMNRLLNPVLSNNSALYDSGSMVPWSLQNWLSGPTSTSLPDFGSHNPFIEDGQDPPMEVAPYRSYPQHPIFVQHHVEHHHYHHHVYHAQP